MSAGLWFAVILVQLVIIGLVIRHEINEIEIYYRIIGGIIFLISAILVRANKQKISKAIILYGIYWVWCIVSGVILSSGPSWLVLRVVLQNYLFVVALAGLTSIRRDIDIAVIPMIIGIIFIMIYGFITKDFSFNEMAFQGARKTAILPNVNTTGLLMLLGIMGTIYFWEPIHSLVSRIVKVILIVFMTIVIILTGSRKSFIMLMLFILLWSWFCYGKLIKNKISIILLILITIYGTYNFGNYVLNNTTLGYRLQETWENPNIDDARKLMYQEAIRLFINYPLAGVGLGNYGLKSIYFSSYSHSDYAEILSTTGIIGFILYFTIYLFLWRGLNDLKKMYNDKLTIYRIGVLKSIVIIILIMSLTVIISQDTWVWILIGAIAGYVHGLTSSYYSKNSKQLLRLNNHMKLIQ